METGKPFALMCVTMKKRALVVEDDPSIRNLVSALLERDGFVVDCASDGMEGQERLSVVFYHVIVMDLMMPKIDGIQLLRQLESTAPNTLSRVVVLTAMNEKTLSRALPSGICRVLGKPFDIQRFREYVGQCAAAA